MSLKLFFNSIPAYSLQDLNGKGFLYDLVEINTGKLPNWKSADIAIFGVEEYRGANLQPEASDNLSNVRKELYRMSEFSHPFQVVDLGNLRLGETLEETYQRLSEVCETLLAKNTLPLVLGGTHDLDYAQFLAYENLDKIVSFLNVDAQLDLEGPEHSPDGNHINKILIHHPNYLFEYSHLGFQRFYNSKKFIDTLSRLNFEMRSVGQIRDNMKEIEPIIRLADIFSFDLSALKGADMPATPQKRPFGLSGEEACQICWYAGTNEKLSSAGFFGYYASLDTNHQGAMVLGTMIWYFIEGFYHRKKEYSFKSSFHIKYIVPFKMAGGSEAAPNQLDNLIFYKSKLSDKWWMEITVTESTKDPLNRNLIIPCSYADFEEANKGNIPDRWYKAIEKLG